MRRIGGMSEIGRIYIERYRRHLNDRDFHDSIFKEIESLSPQRQQEISSNLSKSIHKEKERKRVKYLGQKRRKKIKTLKDILNKISEKKRHID